MFNILFKTGLKTEVGAQQHLQLALIIKMGFTFGTFHWIWWPDTYLIYRASAFALYPFQPCDSVSCNTVGQVTGRTHDATGQAVHVCDLAVNRGVDFKGRHETPPVALWRCWRASAPQSKYLYVRGRGEQCCGLCYTAERGWQTVCCSDVQTLFLCCWHTRQGSSKVVTSHCVM